jgi:glycerol uptake facilitator-like aquaporin
MPAVEAAGAATAGAAKVAEPAAAAKGAAAKDTAVKAADVKGGNIVAVAAEFLGTFFFLSVILAKGEAIPIVVGLLASIHAFGGLSGGHFNPAVSIMILAKHEKPEFTISVFVKYVVAQTLGGIAALSFSDFTKS